MSVSAVLFDLDGTLLDTLEDLYQTVNEVFDKNGYPKRTKDEVRLATGHGAAYLLRSLLPEYVTDERAAEILEEYKPLLKKNQTNNTKPFGGIIDLLTELDKRGVSSAIVSNKPDEVVKGLSEVFFKDTVIEALGDVPDIPRKPDPAGAKVVLNKLKKDIKDAVYVGDSEIDIETAKNLGTPSIGVTWGFRDKEELKAAGADFIIEEPAELLDVIDKLNGGAY